MYKSFFIYKILVCQKKCWKIQKSKKIQKKSKKSKKIQKIQKNPYTLFGSEQPLDIKKNGILMNGHRGFGAIHNALSWFGWHLRVSSSRHIQIETGRWRPKSMARHGRGIAASTSLGQLNSSLSVALCTTRRVKKEEKQETGGAAWGIICHSFTLFGRCRGKAMGDSRLLTAKFDTQGAASDVHNKKKLIGLCASSGPRMKIHSNHGHSS